MSRIKGSTIIAVLACAGLPLLLACRGEASSQAELHGESLASAVGVDDALPVEADGPVRGTEDEAGHAATSGDRGTPHATQPVVSERRPDKRTKVQPRADERPLDQPPGDLYRTDEDAPQRDPELRRNGPRVDDESEALPEPDDVAVGAGTTITLRLDAELGTKDNAAGDEISATVEEDVIATDGMVLIPRGAVALGTVLESRPSEGPDEKAVLVVAFDGLVVDGVERPIVASVIEADLETRAKDSDAETAAKIGVGAAAGAILGKVLGKDNSDAAKGGVAGAVIGSVIASETRAGHAKLKEGARIVVRLERRLVLD